MSDPPTDIEETLLRLYSYNTYVGYQRNRDLLKIRNHYINTFDYGLAIELGLTEDALRHHVERVANRCSTRKAFLQLSPDAIRYFFKVKAEEKQKKSEKFQGLIKNFSEYLEEQLKLDPAFRANCVAKLREPNLVQNLVTLYLLDKSPSYLQEKTFEVHFEALRARFSLQKSRRPQKLPRIPTSHLYTNAFKPVERWLCLELDLSEELLALRLQKCPDLGEIMRNAACDLYEDLLESMQKHHADDDE